MMSLLFGHRSDAVDELERLLEVGELKFAVNVVVLHDGPPGNDLMKFLQFRTPECRDASAAGHAFLVGKMFGHGILKVAERMHIILLVKEPSANLRR